MASGNSKRFPCGHRGRGQYCHRCEMADKLEAMAKSNERLVTHKKAPKAKKWSTEEMLAEALRLRNEGRR